MSEADPAFSSRRRNYMFVHHRRDKFFEFIRDLLEHSFVLDCVEATLPNSWRHVEELVQELHLAQKRNDSTAEKTRLKKMIPSIGHFHTPLKLLEAYEEYDCKYSLSKRKFVRPSFNDVRHILNLSQINALINGLNLVTFDGDCTLYSDGDNFKDPELAWGIGKLLSNGVRVALVTAAGYGLNAAKYENRIALLLDSFSKNNLSETAKQNFYVLGGECNYLLRCGGDSHLIPIPEKEWTQKSAHDWPQGQISKLLDVTQKVFNDAISELKLQCRIIRKERAVGLVPGGRRMKEELKGGSGSKHIRRELLDEVVLRCHAAIHEAGITIPFCAFNGGNDAWVDVGNKKVGVQSLQEYLHVRSECSIHFGDQFTNTGNDIRARSCSTTAWVISPLETKYLIFQLIQKHNWCTQEEILCVRYDDQVTKGGLE